MHAIASLSAFICKNYRLLFGLLALSPWMFLLCSFATPLYLLMCLMPSGQGSWVFWRLPWWCSRRPYRAMHESIIADGEPHQTYCWTLQVLPSTPHRMPKGSLKLYVPEHLSLHVVLQPRWVGLVSTLGCLIVMVHLEMSMVMFIAGWNFFLEEFVASYKDKASFIFYTLELYRSWAQGVCLHCLITLGLSCPSPCAGEGSLALLFTPSVCITYPEAWEDMKDACLV